MSWAPRRGPRPRRLCAARSRAAWTSIGPDGGVVDVVASARRSPDRLRGKQARRRVCERELGHELARGQRRHHGPPHPVPGRFADGLQGGFRRRADGDSRPSTAARRGRPSAAASRRRHQLDRHRSLERRDPLRLGHQRNPRQVDERGSPVVADRRQHRHGLDAANRCDRPVPHVDALPRHAAGRHLPERRRRRDVDAEERWLRGHRSATRSRCRRWPSTRRTRPASGRARRRTASTCRPTAGRAGPRTSTASA